MIALWRPAGPDAIEKEQDMAERRCVSVPFWALQLKMQPWAKVP